MPFIGGLRCKLELYKRTVTVKLGYLIPTAIYLTSYWSKE